MIYHTEDKENMVMLEKLVTEMTKGLKELNMRVKILEKENNRVINEFLKMALGNERLMENTKLKIIRDLQQMRGI